MIFWCTSTPALHLFALNKTIIFFTWHEEVESGSGYRIHILERTVDGGLLIPWPQHLSCQGKKKEKRKAVLPSNFSCSEPPPRPLCLAGRQQNALQAVAPAGPYGELAKSFICAVSTVPSRSNSTLPWGGRRGCGADAVLEHRPGAGSASSGARRAAADQEGT